MDIYGEVCVANTPDTEPWERKFLEPFSESMAEQIGNIGGLYKKGNNSQSRTSGCYPILMITKPGFFALERSSSKLFMYSYLKRE